MCDAYRERSGGGGPSASDAIAIRSSPSSEGAGASNATSVAGGTWRFVTCGGSAVGRSAGVDAEISQQLRAIIRETGAASRAGFAFAVAGQQHAERLWPSMRQR